MQLKLTNIASDIQLNINRLVQSGEAVVLNVGDSVTLEVNTLKEDFRSILDVFKQHLTIDYIDPVKTAEEAAAAKLAADEQAVQEAAAATKKKADDEATALKKAADDAAAAAKKKTEDEAAALAKKAADDAAAAAKKVADQATADTAIDTETK
ncbi:hypothetical protein [Ralstonia phage RP13]|nr:hypothetical protein [Ralstonia phage RP13]